jgi:hypothetical protein
MEWERRIERHSNGMKQRKSDDFGSEEIGEPI